MEETVVQAIRAVHAPNTSIQQRQKAGNYLEQFKNDPQACPKSISPDGISRPIDQIMSPEG